MRRIVRILITLGVVAVIIAVIRRLTGGGGDPAPPVAPWEPLRPEDAARPAPSAPPAAEDKAVAAAPATADDADAAADSDSHGDAGTDSVEPETDGSCPTDFPIKAKSSSKIFHVPGGLSYERTRADRCYRDADAAEADGLRQAKR